MQIGTRVRPDPNHKRYFVWIEQYKGKIGTTTIAPYKSICNNNALWVRVKWDDNSENTYPLDLLIPLTEDEISECITPIALTTLASTWDDVERAKNDPERIRRKKEEQDKMYELPFLPGQRVCLNPEASRYPQLNERVRGNAGYVMYSNYGDADLEKWKTFSNKQEVIVYVKFDNDKIFSCRHKELLSIDAPPKTITRYALSNGDIIRVLEGDDDEHISKAIIVNGYKLRSTTIYDNDWRAKMTEKILNYEE